MLSKKTIGLDKNFNHDNKDKEKLTNKNTQNLNTLEKSIPTHKFVLINGVLEKKEITREDI